MAAPTLRIEAPPHMVKTLKDALMAENILCKACKVSQVNCSPPRYLISTTVTLDGDSIEVAKEAFLYKLEGLDLTEIRVIAGASPLHGKHVENTVSKGIMAGIIEKWVRELPSEVLDSVGSSVEGLLQAFPSAYVIYHPLLLWPRNTFASPPWRELRQRTSLQRLYGSIAKAFGVDYIAISNHIAATSQTAEGANILRSPSGLETVYGDLGPLIRGAPTPSDFSSAVWVRTKQNNITQVWAPLYTMFSQGNISEKTRILHHPTLKPEILDPGTSSAVDLYAGIGYFAFAYAKAGIRTILCWELNPWSVEGLARGARANDWTTHTHSSSPSPSPIVDERIAIFNESNALALQRINILRGSLAPVRHVNCGLLPTSSPIWSDALAMLDPDLGGWVHAHENIAKVDEEARKEEISALFMQYAGKRRRAECVHLERVKSYAPGVFHCVLDMHIGPIAPEGSA